VTELLASLNENAGAIQALATVVLVGATILYVRLAHLAVQEARLVREAEAFSDRLPGCLGRVRVDPIA